jgi:MFS family permease
MDVSVKPIKYLTEFRENWRALASAVAGLAAGLGFINVVTSLFVPSLLSEFGWSKAQVALVGVNTAIGIVSFPLAGRLADMFGPRRIAMGSAILVPFCLMLMSFMDGQIWQYFALSVFMMIVGAGTGAAIYSKAVAERFSNARGIALGIAMSAIAVGGAVGTPIVNDLISTEGWRTAFRIVAAYCLIMAVSAVLLMPPPKAKLQPNESKPRFFEAYSRLVTLRPLWILLIGMFLCNLPTVAITTQVMPMLMTQGLDSSQAAAMISLYLACVVVGRFVCGLSLDRFPAHFVACIAMGVPGIGLAMLGAGVTTPHLVGIAVGLMGLSQGAEGDVAAYLVVRYLGVEVYSTALTIIIASFALSSAVGAMFLALALNMTNSYAPFLLGTAGAVIIGGLILLRLGQQKTED